MDDDQVTEHAIGARHTLPSGAVRVRVHVAGQRVLSVTVPAHLASESGIIDAVRHAVATLPPAVDPRTL